MGEILAIEQPGALERAVELLAQGEIVALPTDTVYGLTAHALIDRAVRRLFEAKERPRAKPVGLFVSGPAQVARVAAGVPPEAVRLMEAFWPGGLTLILPLGPGAPRGLGGPGIGVRMPDHLRCLAILEKLGAPLAQSSANRSGQPDPLTARDVARQLGARVPLILDGGPSGIGQPSTVLDLTRQPPAVLRPGPVSEAAVAEVLGLRVAELGRA